uniref:Uncharacterized protein n=1 Tax=Arundo donax TaxID=35708 RepID=A0A0A9BV48_ARUDO
MMVGSGQICTWRREGK